MQTGKLRHRVQIQQQSTAQDGYNEPIVTWAPLASIWAEIRPLSTRERLMAAADQVQAKADHAIIIRFREDIGVMQRIVYGARIFDIEGVVDPDGRRHRLRLDCSEVAASGVSAPAPDGIAGLALWLDASDLTTLFQDSVVSTPVAANGDPVGKWNDKSGNNNHVTQAGASTIKPTYQTGIQNGKAALSFDGGDYLDSVTTFVNYPLTILGVARTDATTGVSRGLATVRHSTNFGARAILSSGDSIQATVGPTDVSRSATGAVGANTTFLFGMRADASNLYAIKDGVLSSTAAHAASSVSNIVRIGGFNVNSTATLMQGHIMEVLLYTTALSDEQISQLSSYLNSKWAIY